MITHLPYAILNKKLVHISKFESGLDLNCTCPKCGSPLIAKKGDIKIHHFEGDYEKDYSLICSFRVKLLRGEIKSPSDINQL